MKLKYNINIILTNKKVLEYEAHLCYNMMLYLSYSMILTSLFVLNLLFLKFFAFNVNENLDSCFDQFDESEFRVERMDEIAHVCDNRLVVEIFGDAAAHSPNCLKRVLQHFDRGCVEFGTVWNEPACAFSVETFGVHFDQLLQCFVNWECIGLPEFLEWH